MGKTRTTKRINAAMFDYELAAFSISSILFLNRLLGSDTHCLSL